MYNYKKGDLVSAKVTGIEDYGIFVSVNDNVSGLIHISEISNAFVKNVSDYVDIDEIITASVIEYDDVNNKLKLSIKDIDYRGEKKKTKGIVETKSGFTELKNNLSNWVEIKEKEIDKKMKKNGK